MTLEQDSLLRHDRLSGGWSEKYYARRLPRNMDEYDIWKRHRLLKQGLSKIGPVDRALEVGCGTGDNIALCEAGIRDAIDVSEKMIEVARNTHAGINFSVDDIFDFQAEPTYDLVLCLGVIQYVSEYPRLLDKLAGSLRTGGHLVLSFPNRKSFFRHICYARQNNAGLQMDHEETEIIGYLRKLDLSVVDLRPHSSWVPGTGRLSSLIGLPVTFAVDGLYALPGSASWASRLAYSYFGVFCKT